MSHRYVENKLVKWKRIDVNEENMKSLIFSHRSSSVTEGGHWMGQLAVLHAGCQVGMLYLNVVSKFEYQDMLRHDHYVILDNKECDNRH